MLRRSYTPERSPQLDRQSGDRALEIVDQYREEAGEDFRVEPLEVEFPFLAQELGKSAYYLADATENRAGTFKWRGATVGVVDAIENHAVDTVCTMSAGNHGRGLGLAAEMLNVPACIIVPKNAPIEKSEGICRDFPGSRVERQGKNFDEAHAYCDRMGLLDDPHMIPPFDSPAVIAGQGTILDDIVAALPNVESVAVEVGGGGLQAGITRRRDQLGLTNQIEIIGVQAEGSNWLSKSISYGRQMTADAPSQRFGGVAVRQGGLRPYEILTGSQNSCVMTVPMGIMEDFIADYDNSRTESLRGNICPLEPTALIAIAGLTRCGYKETGVTAIVGTGRNAPLYPRAGNRSMKVWNGAHTNYR